MANTSRWPVTVDGVRLDTYAWNIRTRAGRDLVAQVKTPNIDSPNLHGEVWVPGKKSGPGRMVLKMFVQGVDANGVIPADGDSYYRYRKNLDALLTLFGKRHALLDVQQQIRVSPVELRQAMCECTALIEPETTVPSVYSADMTVELSIPDSWWRSVADANWDSATGITSGAVQQLTPFADITAPMEDLYLVVDGPATNPRWEDQASGHFVVLNRTLAGGEQWVVDTSNWTSKTGTAIAFTAGGTDRRADTQYGGYLLPRMFGVTPLTPNPRAVVTFTAGSAATRARIRGRLKYQ